jgi:hypothetical protein
VSQPPAAAQQARQSDLPSVSSFREPELDWLPRGQGGRCVGLRDNARAPTPGVLAVSRIADSEARGEGLAKLSARRFASRPPSVACRWIPDQLPS